jgi:asparagine synthase (glutamine-hydrolysing)
VLKRPKQPYRAPEGKSFLGSSQAAYVDDLLSREQIRKDGIFHAEAVEKLMQKFRDERAIGIKDNMAITGVLSTQLVIHQFIHNFRGGLGHG